MLQLWPDGSGKILILGSDIMKGMQPQVVVPRNIWQGARLLRGGEFALLGTTVSPGFEFKDYESGKRKELISSHPGFRDFIIALTKEDNVR
jgi:predicted cupin superfamily sugar epimerase